MKYSHNYNFLGLLTSPGVSHQPGNLGWRLISSYLPLNPGQHKHSTSLTPLTTKGNECKALWDTSSLTLQISILQARCRKHYVKFFSRNSEFKFDILILILS